MANGLQQSLHLALKEPLDMQLPIPPLISLTWCVDVKMLDHLPMILSQKTGSDGLPRMGAGAVSEGGWMDHQEY